MSCGRSWTCPSCTRSLTRRGSGPGWTPPWTGAGPRPRPNETAAKQRVRAALLLAAVLALTAGSALAAYRADLLALFFPGDDTSALAPYVQTGLDTIETKDWRATVDSALYDGQSLYAVVTLQGRTPEAADGLTSGEIVADGYWDYYWTSSRPGGPCPPRTGRASSAHPGGRRRGPAGATSTPTRAGTMCGSWSPPPQQPHLGLPAVHGRLPGGPVGALHAVFSFLGPELSVQILWTAGGPSAWLRPWRWRPTAQGLEGVLTECPSPPCPAPSPGAPGGLGPGGVPHQHGAHGHQGDQLFALRRSDGTLLTPGRWEHRRGQRPGRRHLCRPPRLEGRADLSGTGLTVTTFDAPLDLEDVTPSCTGAGSSPWTARPLSRRGPGVEGGLFLL